MKNFIIGVALAIPATVFSYVTALFFIKLGEESGLITWWICWLIFAGVYGLMAMLVGYIYDSVANALRRYREVPTTSQQ